MIKNDDLSGPLYRSQDKYQSKYQSKIKIHNPQNPKKTSPSLDPNSNPILLLPDQRKKIEKEEEARISKTHFYLDPASYQNRYPKKD